MCRPCLGHLDKLSTNGCKCNSAVGKFQFRATTVSNKCLDQFHLKKKKKRKWWCKQTRNKASPYLWANKPIKPPCMTHKENTWISFSPTSAILMNCSPFNGSNNVLQFDDPVHLPCTKIKDILSSRYLYHEAW